jgi:hypothetical protein
MTLLHRMLSTMDRAAAAGGIEGTLEFALMAESVAALQFRAVLHANPTSRLVVSALEEPSSLNLQSTHAFYRPAPDPFERLTCL